MTDLSSLPVNDLADTVTDYLVRPRPDWIEAQAALAELQTRANQRDQAARSADRALLADAIACNDTAFVAELLEAAEARLAETLDLLKDGADMAERYMGTLSGGLESWVVLVRAHLTTHHTDDG